MADVASTSRGGDQFATTSLYVADLDLTVTDAQLYDLFNEVGMVVAVRVCRDSSTRKSLGYGYVNYYNSHDAAHAIKNLNFTALGGKSIRIMYSNRDPGARTNGKTNIYIKNLDKTIDNKALYDMLSGFGNILSSKIATDDSGESKGYGFVQFDNEESSQKAIDNINNTLINDKRVFVGHFLSKEEREAALTKAKSHNLYVKNLSESTTVEDLKKIFGEYGIITSAVVVRDGDGKSKGFGFVNFDNADAAAKAIEALNGRKSQSKNWYVGKAQNKSERELELKSQFDQSPNERADEFQGLNLYVKNLDDSIDDDKFKELFSQFGTIISCKVMRDASGISRGSGFVSFSSPEEVSHAFIEMNGKMVKCKQLYVALAQSKEEREARLLQAQFSQMQPVAMAPLAVPRVPVQTPGALDLGQQLFYDQAAPASIPPEAGFGYEQQFVPQMRPPHGAPMPNLFVPSVQQSLHSGARRGAEPVYHQPQQIITRRQQQQMLPIGYIYPYSHRVPEIPMPGGAGSGISVPYDVAHEMLSDWWRFQL